MSESGYSAETGWCDALSLVPTTGYGCSLKSHAGRARLAPGREGGREGVADLVPRRLVRRLAELFTVLAQQLLRLHDVRVDAAQQLPQQLEVLGGRHLGGQLKKNCYSQFS